MKNGRKDYFWDKLFPLLLTAVIGLGGYYFVDSLAAKRDRANKRRDLRTEYLISAFRKLANASERHHKPGSQYLADIETAMADIQLFGRDSQIEKANETMDKLQQGENGLVNELLRDLRNDLRKEMDLSRIKGNVQWLRIDVVPN